LLRLYPTNADSEIFGRSKTSQAFRLAGWNKTLADIQKVSFIRFKCGRSSCAIRSIYHARCPACGNQHKKVLQAQLQKLNSPLQLAEGEVQTVTSMGAE
jgi:bacterioferritin-associated ferredoxin